MNPEKQQKMRTLLSRTIRYSIFTGVLVGVFFETGFWTALLFVLMLTESELKTYLMSKVVESQQWLVNIVMRIVQKCQEDTDENSPKD